MKIVASECCYPNCAAPLSGTLDQPLCDRHAVAVYREVRDAMGDPTAQALAAIAPAPTTKAADPRSTGSIYFVQFGDRIKIGFTTNMKQRMKVIPKDQILATTPGSLGVERRIHNRFAHLRITGEWFRADKELLDYVEFVRQRNKRLAAK